MLIPLSPLIPQSRVFLPYIWNLIWILVVDFIIELLFVLIADYSHYMRFNAVYGEDWTLFFCTRIASQKGTTTSHMLRLWYRALEIYVIAAYACLAKFNLTHTNNIIAVKMNYCSIAKPSLSSPLPFAVLKNFLPTIKNNRFPSKKFAWATWRKKSSTAHALEISF